MTTNNSLSPPNPTERIQTLPIPFVERTERATHAALNRFGNANWNLDIDRARTSLSMLQSVLDLRSHDTPQHQDYDHACAVMRRAKASIDFLESYRQLLHLRTEIHHANDRLINTRVQMSIAREKDDPDSYARLVRTVEQLRDEIAEMKARIESIEHTARHDSLTGVLTRSAILDAIDAEWTQSSTQQLDMGLLFIDIDTFKQINDTYDHATGDAALALVGTQILRCLKRTGELVGRYGGDEFLVLLPNVTLNDVAAIAEIIRISVAAAKLPHDNDHIQVTVSIGGSVATPTSDAAGKHGAANLRKRADDALAQAKVAGRNRTAVHTNDNPPKILAIAIDDNQHQIARPRTTTHVDNNEPHS